MDDLISRQALLKEMNAYKFDTVNDTARRTEHAVKAHMFDLVERQPAALDLKSIMEQLENMVQYAEKKKTAYRNARIPHKVNAYEAAADAYRDSIRIIRLYTYIEQELEIQKLSADDYKYLYAKLDSSKIPEHIHAKIMDGDDLTEEEERIMKEIITADRRNQG